MRFRCPHLKLKKKETALPSEVAKSLFLSLFILLDWKTVTNDRCAENRSDAVTRGEF